MSGADLPDEVVQFLLDHIDSVPHLEALLLVRESAPRPWTAVELALRVYVTPPEAVRLLQSLERQGWITVDGEHHRFVARTADAAILEQVSAHYRSHLVRVAQLIHSKASPAIREFARAFQVNKGDS